MMGLFAAYRLNMRVVMLEKCIVMLNSIRSEIQYLLLPSSEIIESLALRKDLSELTFLQDCKRRILDGSDFRTAWREALENNGLSLCFNKDDIHILISFSELFGVTGCDGQFLNCNLYCEKLQSALNDAKKAKEKYSRLFSSLGLLAGLYFIIIFI